MPSERFATLFHDSASTVWRRWRVESVVRLALTRLRQQMAFGAGVFDVGGQKSSLHFGFNF